MKRNLKERAKDLLYANLTDAEHNEVLDFIQWFAKRAFRVGYVMGFLTGIALAWLFYKIYR